MIETETYDIFEETRILLKKGLSNLSWREKMQVNDNLFELEERKAIGFLNELNEISLTDNF